jgi:cytochrome c556
MESSKTLMGILAAGLVVSACAKKTEEAPAPAAAAAPTVFETMNASIIPMSNKIWELAGNLYDDKGNLDAKKLTDAQWNELKDSAVAMGASAKSLAETAGIKVAAEGVKIQGEGTAGAASAADVQKSIDADTKGFADAATKLVAMSDEIVAASTAHDAMKTDDAQGRLTDVCGECHKKFWYPNQPAQ